MFSGWGTGVDRCQGAGEDDPGQDGLGSQAEHNVEAFAKQGILPRFDLLLLQNHVDSEDVEEDKQGRDDGVNERWRSPTR